MFLLYTRAFVLTLLTLTGSLLYGSHPLDPAYSARPQKEDITLIFTAANPTNKKVSVLLFHNKGGYWSAIPKDEDELEGLFKLGEINFKKEEADKFVIDTSEGGKKSGIIILPIPFKAVDELRKSIDEESTVDDFVWVPVEEITSRITALSKPLSPFAQKSALGKSSLALVDPQTQKAVKTAASKINLVGGTPRVPLKIKKTELEYERIED